MTEPNKHIFTLSILKLLNNEQARHKSDILKSIKNEFNIKKPCEPKIVEGKMKLPDCKFKFSLSSLEAAGLIISSESNNITIWYPAINAYISYLSFSTVLLYRALTA